MTDVAARPAARPAFAVGTTVVVAAAVTALVLLLGRGSADAQADQVAKGRQLYLTGCVSCHGTNAEGAANLPRLAGQIPGYIHTQLKSFNKRERTNDNAVMHAVVEKMTELEMAAVAEYVSSK